MLEDSEMQDDGRAGYTDDLKEKFPNKPSNHSKTLPFHDLFLTLFNPLNENKKKPTGLNNARRKHGPDGPRNLTPHEIRRSILAGFIARWRKEVGNDIFPAMRLIVPEKDRDRAMYGLKEKTIGKLLVRVLKIDKNSEDGLTLMNWKLPGRNTTSHTAGDFAARCYEVISKRPMRSEVGSMSIEEVNDQLDRLADAPKEEDQLPIFQDFYQRMNPEELMWLIRIILRQMKVGATEKTIFEIWHPDAELLFNISSSLRRVCWELYDVSVRLDGSDTDINLMQCFQPQLAQFQMHSFDKSVEKMRLPVDDNAFWIEEKLDGERMQLHMLEDDTVKGGKRFGFWSRKAKDYTYLYGNGFHDENGSLTRHLQNAFHEGVRNVILDGEMIEWDVEQDVIRPFGTLKTAAISEQKNVYSGGNRPLFRVFDILYLNDEALTKYTLKDRRRALDASVTSVHRRMEIHPYQVATTSAEIEPLLRQVIAESSEGLVLKNPHSRYRLNSRNDDWVKVKPEYMSEFGEALDCVIIGGYYGSGHRGGNLSSFLCGLRVDENDIRKGVNPAKCYSFFKVGGGMTAADYQSIRHATEGKWHDWNSQKPPTEYIELAGGDRQYERPDKWIRADESIVVSVKAASVSQSSQFFKGWTLRFPRFTKLRNDRSWDSALTYQGFLDLKKSAEKEQQQKQFIVDNARKAKRARTTKDRPLIIAGYENRPSTANLPASWSTEPVQSIFTGLNFHVMTESLPPNAMSKADIEALLKARGGKLFQSPTAAENTICIADRKLVKVASLQKTGKKSIIRPRWLLDCAKQCAADADRTPLLLPFEPCHCLFVAQDDQTLVARQVDGWGDSFARDLSVEELQKQLDSMPSKFEHAIDAAEFLEELYEHGQGFSEKTIGQLMNDLTMYIDDFHSTERDDDDDIEMVTDDQEHSLSDQHRTNIVRATSILRFFGATISTTLDDATVTHIVLMNSRPNNKAGLKRHAADLRRQIKNRSPMPRIVTSRWVMQCWTERTRLDEERFVP